MKALKLLFAALAAVTMTFTAQAAKTAKAVVADGGTTLKFVYDTADYGTKDVGWFSVAEAEAIDPQTDDVPWASYGGRVTKVIFDPSFAGYRPTQCGSWFYGFSSLATIEGIKNLDTSEAANFAYMFDYCLTLTALDLSGFDTAKATDMHFMFADSKNLKTISVSDRFVTTAVTDSYAMFSSCSSLVGGEGTCISYMISATYARIDGGPSAPGYFTRGPVYTVDFVGNDATSGAMPSHKYCLGQVYNLPKCAFKKTGKAFKGWAGSNGKRYDDGILIFNAAEEGKTLTLTAVWKE